MTLACKGSRAALRASGSLLPCIAAQTTLGRQTSCRVVPAKWCNQAVRGYLTRQHMDRHMAKLQKMANTVKPADVYNNFRFAKIVCTIGPKVANDADIEMLMSAGMNVARFNFSHGEYDWFENTFSIIRDVKKKRGRPDIAIALDTKGPEIRTGQFAEGSPSDNPAFSLAVKPGQTVTFSTDKEFANAGDASTIYIDYADIGSTLKAGDAMMIDDGLLEFTVSESGNGWVKAVAQNAGSLGERKGVNLPGAEVTLPAVSAKDKADIEFGVQQGVDMIFASFVRKRSHVDELRAALGKDGQHVKIISKIENLEGVQNFDEILEASDGIMVARGDLGIEIPAAKVVVAQKLMINKCNRAGKPVICATQMLDSMVTNPRPTRAEVSDVANAIIDGADAVMLSGETAKGAFPREAVTSMASVVREAEATMDTETMERVQQLVMPRPASSAEAVSGAVARTAQDQNAALVMVVTETGEAPRLVAKYRPPVPIFAVCNEESTARQCALLRGVVPLVIPFEATTGNPTQVVNNLIKKAAVQVKDMGIKKEGSAIVLHDSDISDKSEMTDWVMRVLDMDAQ